MAEKRGLGIWIAVALLAAIVGAFFESRSSGPFDAADAASCAERAADELGYPVQTPQVVDRRGTWNVTAGGKGVVLHLEIRAADERITDVRLLRNANADVLTRDERLAVFERGC